MIQYSLDMQIPPFEKGIDYRDALVLTGSCFTDHLSSRLKESYFNVYSQPNGVVFNPISLADSSQRICSIGDYNEEDLIYHNGLWHSKFHHGSFSEPGKQDTLHRINHELHAFKKSLKNAKFLFITFGSAYVYEYLLSGEVVANCHKIPQDQFRKRLLEVNEIVLVWVDLIRKIKAFNPQLQIVFTVSPVKHLKDGIVGNTLSKSTLLLSIQKIIETISEVAYFPAFELVNDDLRDYRFYENDGAHPNTLAIDYVYEKFKSTFFSPQCLAYVSDVEKYNRISSHHLMREDGEEYLHFMRQLEAQRSALNQKYGLDL